MIAVPWISSGMVAGISLTPEVSGALTKKETMEDTIHDWLYIMRQNGHEEEQIQLAIDKIKKFF